MGDVGGIEGAEALCMERAGAAVLEGTFRAWLSTTSLRPTRGSTRATARQPQCPGLVEAISGALSCTAT